MRWFRLQRRPAGWLALLALALQLALSFGHVHGLAADPHAAVVAIADDGGAPAPQPVSDHRDNYCAICAILAMLGGAQTASAPALAAPIALAAAEIFSTTEAARAASPCAAFRSRAPPIS